MSQDLVNSYEGGVGKVVTQGMRINKTAAQTVLGTIRNLAVGRQIVYAKVGAAAISACTVCQSKAQTGGSSVVPCGATASIGAKTVNLKNTAAWSADKYKDGFMCVHCGTGTGYSYMVDYHKSAAATDLSCNVTLKDGLEVALTTASICSLVENKYNGIIASVSDEPTMSLVGVGLCTGSINTYVWLGKKGPFLVVTDTLAITAGKPVFVGCAAGTINQVRTAEDTIKPMVGHALQSAAANSAVRILVDLDL